MTDFGPLLDDIARQLDAYRARGLRMFTTSSFQTGSVALLHVLSRLGRDVPVYFLDTGYHFPETLCWRDQLGRDLGLEVRTVRSAVPRIQQRDPAGRLLFASDPDWCCHLNKVEPMEPLLAAHDVWINGVRAGQSAVRAGMAVEQPTRHGCLRYHPILGWTARMVWEYREQHGLPPHPLEAQGYFSVGCAPCTRAPDAGGDLDDRSGRWKGMHKTECGLHTDLGRAS